jgi:erythromycin esterase
VLDYLEKVDPAYHRQVVGRLAPLLDKDALGAGARKDPEKIAPFAPVITELVTRLTIQGQTYSRRSSAREWAWAARQARVLAEFVESNHGDADENVIARDKAGPASKMVLWAHNAHVARWRDRLTQPTLGKHLRDALGPAYYAFGFAFNQGSFQAVYDRAGPKDPPRGLMEHSVAPEPPGSVGATLALVGAPILALDLRSAPADGPTGAFWHERRRLFEVGSRFREGATYALPYVPLAEDFDGVLFVEHTTAAHPTLTGQPPPLPAPTSAQGAAAP